jgi:hypothetical protein
LEEERRQLEEEEENENEEIERDIVAEVLPGESLVETEDVQQIEYSAEKLENEFDIFAVERNVPVSHQVFYFIAVD